VTSPLFEIRDLRVSAARQDILRGVNLTVDGRIVESGGTEVAARLEQQGYDSVESS